jgi:hypothetical protein
MWGCSGRAFYGREEEKEEPESENVENVPNE